ncbi:MAG: hypothetical protein IKD34_01305, partial [Oscillospiraceae bacterium]|nr:hypothetical protein [Oscillospiraceae bacterium]
MGLVPILRVVSNSAKFFWYHTLCFGEKQKPAIDGIGGGLRLFGSGLSLVGGDGDRDQLYFFVRC